MSQTSKKEQAWTLKSPHYLCWFLAATVFPLIWVGGLVTTTDAGMAVPDWPGTYGYNMWLYPISTWFYGPFDLFIEHGHRLLGTLAGFISIGLVVVSFRTGDRSFFWLSFLALLLVCFQGALGGVRVLQMNRLIAMIHGCVGPAFFAFVAVLLVRSSRWLETIDQKVFTIQQEWNRSVAFFFRSQIQRLRNLSICLLVASYLQLVVGANMRHVQVDATPGFFRSLVWFHIILACCIFVVVFYIARWRLAIKTNGLDLGLNRCRFFLAFLVVGQICLGLGSWVLKFGFPDWAVQLWPQFHSFLIQEKNHWQVQIVTGHVAIGSLIVATAAWLTIKATQTNKFAEKIFQLKGAES